MVLVVILIYKVKLRTIANMIVTAVSIYSNALVCALNDKYSSYNRKPESESLLNAEVTLRSFSKPQG